jgi:hypothetical protein
MPAKLINPGRELFSRDGRRGQNDLSNFRPHLAFVVADYLRQRGEEHSVSHTVGDDVNLCGA